MADVPQGTQAECAFFTSDAVISLSDVVSIDETLERYIVSRQAKVKSSTMGKFTLDVNPPLSGLFNTALRVLKNLGSDGFIKNTSGMIMTLESNTSVSSYDCPNLCRSLFHALCIICS